MKHEDELMKVLERLIRVLPPDQQDVKPQGLQRAILTAMKARADAQQATDNAESVGAVLRAVRERRALQLEDVAKQAGIEVVEITQLEEDRMPPWELSPDVFVALLACLSVPVTFIFTIVKQTPILISDTPAPAQGRTSIQRRADRERALVEGSALLERKVKEQRKARFLEDLKEYVD